MAAPSKTTASIGQATARMALAPIGVTTLVLVVGWSLANRATWALLAGGVGVGWLLATWLSASVIWSDACFGMLTLLTVIAIRSGIAPGWGLLAVIAALSGWDLVHLAQRLRVASQAAEAAHLRRLHLRRLAIVDVLGAAVAAVALASRLSLGLLPVVFLSLLAIALLSILARWPQRSGSDDT